MPTPETPKQPLPPDAPPTLTKEQKLKLLDELKDKIAEMRAVQSRLKEAKAKAKTSKDPATKEEITTLTKELRKLIDEGKKIRLTIEGETTPDSIIATYQREWKKDAGTLERTQNIEITLNITAILETFKTFYETHGIPLPPDFETTIRNLWNKHKEEIKKAIEQQGFDTLLLIPSGLTLPDLNTSMTKIDGIEYKVKTQEWTPIKDITDSTGKTETSTPRLVLLHKAQNLQDIPELKTTLGQTAQALIEQGQALTLTDYLIFQRAYFEETGKHLDEIGWTWLPGSKSGAHVVSAYWNPDVSSLNVDALDPEYSDSDLGCRLSRSFL